MSSQRPPVVIGKFAKTNKYVSRPRDITAAQFDGSDNGIAEISKAFKIPIHKIAFSEMERAIRVEVSVGLVRKVMANEWLCYGGEEGWTVLSNDRFEQRWMPRESNTSVVITRS